MQLKMEPSFTQPINSSSVDFLQHLVCGYHEWNMVPYYIQFHRIFKLCSNNVQSKFICTEQNSFCNTHACWSCFSFSSVLLIATYQKKLIRCFTVACSMAVHFYLMLFNLNLLFAQLINIKGNTTHQNF